MIPRSWLFIPGDSDKKLAKADASGADAIILDLEDAVAASRKPAAREMVRAFLGERPQATRAMQIWVRVNPLGGPVLDDLAATIGGAPDGVMLPKCEGPHDIRRLSHYLEALEAREGLPPGVTRILPVATETAIAPFRLGDYAGANLTRLIGLTWGAEDLSAALGARTNRDASGEWSFVYQWARAACLLGAKAAGVAAIDTLWADYKDAEGLRAASRAAAQEGFSGRLAIHPAQVAIINESFAPSAAEVEHARAVIAAFAADPAAGTVGLDGKMLDRPHLIQAQQVIAQHEAYGAAAR